MKKIIIVACFYIVGWQRIQAQKNLVPNPSFEQIEKCTLPTEPCLLSLAKPWFSPNNATPDVFNKCAPQKFAGAWSCGIWKQKPKTGLGYANIFTYAHWESNSWAREYCEVELTEKMKVNKKYYIEFFASALENDYTNAIQCFTDGIGLAVSEKKYYSPDSNINKITDLKPIIECKSILEDTSNWTKINTFYQDLKKDNAYIIIGNFKLQAEIKAHGDCGKSFPNFSETLIDDVGVYEFDLVPDTLYICDKESKKIGKEFLTATYQWNTGQKDSIISVNSNGMYIVTATIDQAQMSDTVYVINPKNTLPKALKDTTKCINEKVIYRLPNIGTYDWSDGQKGANVVFEKGGNYQVNAKNQCLTETYSFNITDKECECKVFIPNVFSPNNDNVNDTFRCFDECDLNSKVIRFQIYDRWGNHLYIVNDVPFSAIEWDGVYRNELVEQGIYAFSIEYQYTKNNVLIRETKTGTFNLFK